jgi:hypothetical protein
MYALTWYSTGPARSARKRVTSALGGSKSVTIGDNRDLHFFRFPTSEEATVVLCTAVSGYDRCFGDNRSARWRGNAAADGASDPTGSKNGRVAELASDQIRRRIESRLMDMLPGTQPLATRSKRALSDDCYFGKRIRDGGLELD